VVSGSSQQLIDGAHCPLRSSSASRAASQHLPAGSSSQPCPFQTPTPPRLCTRSTTHTNGTSKSEPGVEVHTSGLLETLERGLHRELGGRGAVEPGEHGRGVHVERCREGELALAGKSGGGEVGVEEKREGTR
jgi:hypothetical protein